MARKYLTSRKHLLLERKVSRSSEIRITTQILSGIQKRLTQLEILSDDEGMCLGMAARSVGDAVKSLVEHLAPKKENNK